MWGQRQGETRGPWGSSERGLSQNGVSRGAKHYKRCALVGMDNEHTGRGISVSAVWRGGLVGWCHWALRSIGTIAPCMRIVPPLSDKRTW